MVFRALLAEVGDVGMAGGLAPRLLPAPVVANVRGGVRLSGGDFVVLDSETTGLGTPIDFVEVGVVSGRGEVLFDSLIKPSCSVEPGASRVRGHTGESLLGGPVTVKLSPGAN